MPPFQPALPPAQAHNNQQLFSDYYLNIKLPERPDWKILAHDAKHALARITTIFEQYTPSDNEAQTERDLVRPVLEALGHTFEVQPSLRTAEGTKKPDYVFYRDKAEMNASKNKLLDDALLLPRAFAVGDAKYWNRPLDIAIKSGGDPFTNKNPGYQIAFYMQHSGMDWGILTNGRLWRLYHKDSAHKLDRFYEVDLQALVEAGDAERFLYFYGFFHRSAFEPGPLGVAALLRASADYARAVGDTLKTQVYTALRHLAQGFLDYEANGLGSDPDTLKAIYDNSLIALYRVLFVLYAEARDLLPLRESQNYRDSYSFTAIKQAVAGDLGMGRSLLPGSATLWPRLRELFRIIDAGSPPLKVATFNGGLFDPRRHPFLERYTVGDAHLQQAIDKLARVGGEFVDYRDLAERHLGTIYEGLLEYHLEAITPEEQWTVALLNDKGERKASGSYYTPDYIVKYIVDQTVGPVLRAAVAGLQDDRARAAAVLDVNVLDPAMGSGHFLVEATEYIARFLVDLAVTPGADARGEADLQYWKRRVAQSCIYGVDLNPLAVDLAKLSLWLSTVAKDRPLSFLDHHLRTGNALIGARIADLRVGGSGAGAQKRSRKAAPVAGQLSLLDDDAFRQSMSTAVDSMWLIEGSAGETVADVKEQERIYAGLRESLTRRYGRLADLVTATYFGVKIDPTMWQPLADYATGRVVAALPRFSEWVETAEAIAAERRFFHWELEFPEVFFDRHGQPLGEAAGFDAVVGNPPYVRQEELGDLKHYFSTAYQEVFHGMADLYVYFFGKGLGLVRENGHLGYISSSTFTKLNFGAPLRQFLTSQSTLVEIIEFGEQQVFTGAITYPIIAILTKQTPSSDTTLKTGNFSSILRSAPVLHDAAVPKGSAIWAFGNSGLHRLLQGWELSQALGEVLGTPIFRGLTTGLNEAFVIDETTRNRLVSEDPASQSILKPFIRGEDIGRWYQENRQQWLILFPSGWTKANVGDDVTEQEGWHGVCNRYPAISRHLISFAPAARIRFDQGDYWWELRPCSYYSVFERPRIHSTKVSLAPTFSFSTETFYTANTSYVLPVQDGHLGEYLLTLLNSRISAYFCRNVFAPKANGYYEVQPGELRKFPIRRIAFTTSAEERERLRDKGRKLYEQFCAKDDYACVLGFVDHQLPRLTDGSADTANEKSDAVHDLLAYLAEQMIELNKQRQAAVEDFALDLEGVLSGADLQKIERLWTPPGRPKEGDEDATKQAAYTKAVEEARVALGELAGRRLELRGDIGRIDEEQWKWLLKRRLKKIDSLADLVKTYRKHQPSIAALDRRIAATDRLIDRVVYRLYGLNEEEIAIVEGRTL